MSRESSEAAVGGHEDRASSTPLAVCASLFFVALVVAWAIVHGRVYAPTVETLRARLARYEREPIPVDLDDGEMRIIPSRLPPSFPTVVMTYAVESRRPRLLTVGTGPKSRGTTSMGYDERTGLWYGYAVVSDEYVPMANLVVRTVGPGHGRPALSFGTSGATAYIPVGGEAEPELFRPAADLQRPRVFGLGDTVTLGELPPPKEGDPTLFVTLTTSPDPDPSGGPGLSGP